MMKRYKILSILAAFLVCMVMAFPGVASAQTLNGSSSSVTPESLDQKNQDCHGGQDVNDPTSSPQGMRLLFQTSHAGVAQYKVQAVNEALSLHQAIDTKLAHCWTQIEAIFLTLGSLSDPSHLMYAIISAIILPLIDQACALTLSVLQQMKSFVLSQLNLFCVPLPAFGLGGISLNLHGPPCHGTPLLTLTPNAPPKNPALLNLDPQSFFKK